MRRVHRDEAAVDAEAQTLFRPDDLQIRVGVQRQRDERGEGVGHGNIAGNQIVVQVLIFEHVDVAAQRVELFRRLREHRVVGGIHALVHGEQHHADGHARVVDQAEAVFKGRIPQVVEALDVDLHRGRIVDDQRNAAHIRHDVLVVRIEELMGEALVQVGIVIHDGGVERLHQPGFAGGVEHVVAGQHHVVITAVYRGELFIHLLVAGEGRVVDFDARLLLKRLDDGRVVDVTFPGEDVEHGLIGLVLGLRQGAAADGQQRKQQAKKFLHVHVPP